MKASLVPVLTLAVVQFAPLSLCRAEPPPGASDSLWPEQVSAPAPVPVLPAPPPATPTDGSALPQGAIYFDGPVWIIPASPTQPAPPALPGLAPPVPIRAKMPPSAAPPSVRLRPTQPVSGLGLGGRWGLLWTNQQVYGSNVLLNGGGADVRLRLGSVAVEASFDVLGTDEAQKTFSRTSYPLQLGLLYDLLPTRPGLFFNVHLSAGAGVLPTRLTLWKDTPLEYSASATEVLGQVGTGCEIRLWHFAITADARVLGLWRASSGDELDPSQAASGSTAQAAFAKSGLTQALIPEKSYGWTFTLGALLWL